MGEPELEVDVEGEVKMDGEGSGVMHLQVALKGQKSLLLYFYRPIGIWWCCDGNVMGDRG